MIYGMLFWCFSFCEMNPPQSAIIEEPFTALRSVPSAREDSSRMTLQREKLLVDDFARDAGHPPNSLPVWNIHVNDSPLEGGVVLHLNAQQQNNALAQKGLWISAEELAKLPTSGAAWENLLQAANEPIATPSLFDQNDPTNVRVLAKALVFARLKEEKYREAVVNALQSVTATQAPAEARTLALGRELVAYVIAADLIALHVHAPKLDAQFRAQLRALRTASFNKRTLISTHEQRANNWGTHAGASRVAIAAYLDDEAEVQRCAQVFRGWLGERTAYSNFKFGDKSWQADTTRPVAINAKGAQREGHSLDGALPEELRRAGKFAWPPPQENYIYEALQGALVQAVILHRAGYEVWQWGDRALLRAFEWLYEHAKFAARGDDAWQVYVINHYYHTHFPTSPSCAPGKNVGWADWTHGAN